MAYFLRHSDVNTSLHLYSCSCEFHVVVVEFGLPATVDLAGRVSAWRSFDGVQGTGARTVTTRYSSSAAFIGCCKMMMMMMMTVTTMMIMMIIMTKFRNSSHLRIVIFITLSPDVFETYVMFDERKLQ